LAFQELLPHIKERFSSQEFKSLSHLVQRLSSIDVHVQGPRRSLFQKKVAFIEDSSNSKDEAEIGLAEWTRNKKPVSCLFAKKDIEKYGVDITKADRIFDLLLQEGQIKLSPNHSILSAVELKNCKYCKWNKLCPITPTNAKHSVNISKTAIEQGRIKFENPTKLMIDGHPFPAKMVEVSNQNIKGKLKVWTSGQAKQTGAVDPRVQILVDELKIQS
jgi:hypothetical protein